MVHEKDFRADPSDPRFGDYWAKLGNENPALFERMRQEVLEAHIAQTPMRHHRRLYRLLETIDAAQAKAVTPDEKSQIALLLFFRLGIKPLETALLDLQAAYIDARVDAEPQLTSLGATGEERVISFIRDSP